MYRPGIPGKANPLLCARRRTRLHASPLGSAAPRDYSKAFCAQRYLSSEGLGGSQSCPVLFAQRLPQQGDRAPVPKSAHLGMCVITRGLPQLSPQLSMISRVFVRDYPREKPQRSKAVPLGRAAAELQQAPRPLPGENPQLLRQKWGDQQHQPLCSQLNAAPSRPWTAPAPRTPLHGKLRWDGRLTRLGYSLPKGQHGSPGRAVPLAESPGKNCSCCFGL